MKYALTLLPVYLLLHLCSVASSRRLRTCGPVPHVENGVPESDDTRIRAKIRYTCNDGYVHTGKTAKNKCKQDGTWTDNVRCTRDDGCDRPDFIGYAILEPDITDRKYPKGTVVQVRCDLGYRLKGSRSITCHSFQGNYQWSSRDSRCERGSCSYPGTPFHGWKDSQDYTVGNQVRYFCNPGYSLRGSRIRTCLADGTWTGREPSCIRTCCSKLESPVGGKVEGQGQRSCFGDQVTVSCDLGHVINGTTETTVTVTCTESGVWDPPSPTCVVKPCKEQYIKNGTVAYTGFNYADYIKYTCDDFTTTVGETFGLCSIDGDWSIPPPQCLQHCKEYWLENGNNHYKNKLVLGYVPHETQRKLGCNHNRNMRKKFILSPPSRFDQYVNCNDGSWTGHTSTICKPAPCSLTWKYGTEYFVGESKLYMYSYQSYEVQSNTHVTTTCAYGYELTTNIVSTRCDHGYWSSDPPVCSKIKCSLHEVKGTTYYQDYYKQYERLGAIEHDEVVYIGCSQGFKVIHPQLTCKAGHMMPQTLPCEELFCNITQMGNAQPKYPSQKEVYSHNEYVDIKCTEGYTLYKDAQDWLTCSNGAWTPKREYCAEHCKDYRLENGNNHNWKESDLGYVPHNTYRYLYCINDEYMKKKSILSPPGSRQYVTCKDGSWTGDITTSCKPVPCSINAPDGTEYYLGEIKYTYEVPSDTTVTAKCLYGYELTTNIVSARCGYGYWSSGLPVCSKMKCILHKVNGTTYYSNDYWQRERVGVIEHDEVVNVGCSQGFKVIHSQLTCKAGNMTPQTLPCEELLTTEGLNRGVDFESTEKYFAGLTTEGLDKGVNFETTDNKSGVLTTETPNKGVNFETTKNKFYAPCKEYRLENGTNHYRVIDNLRYVDHGTTITLRCINKNKFILSPPGMGQQVRCDDGSWTGDTNTTCEPVLTTESPNKGVNSESTGNKFGVLTTGGLNERVNFETTENKFNVLTTESPNKGINFETTENKFGAPCKEYRLENGNNHFRVIENLRSVDHGTTVTLYCINGYFIHSPRGRGQQVKCDNGSWTGDINITCEPVLSTKTPNEATKDESDEAILEVLTTKTPDETTRRETTRHEGIEENADVLTTKTPDETARVLTTKTPDDTTRVCPRMQKVAADSECSDSHWFTHWLRYSIEYCISICLRRSDCKGLLHLHGECVLLRKCEYKAKFSERVTYEKIICP